MREVLLASDGSARDGEAHMMRSVILCHVVGEELYSTPEATACRRLLVFQPKLLFEILMNEIFLSQRGRVLADRSLCSTVA